jgi:hypothetical protein
MAVGADDRLQAVADLDERPARDEGAGSDDEVEHVEPHDRTIAVAA